MEDLIIFNSLDLYTSSSALILVSFVCEVLKNTMIGFKSVEGP